MFGWNSTEKTSHPRTGARVVEWARLESVCTGNGTEGSNPSLSAIFLSLRVPRARTQPCWVSDSTLFEIHAEQNVIGVGTEIAHSSAAPRFWENSHS